MSTPNPRPRLALHTWTLDTTPLDEVLRIARDTGWDAVELRRVDFARASEAGRTAADVEALVRASGLGVACVGVEPGWLFAEGAERDRLLDVFRASCRSAVALGCTTLMSAVDRGRGDVRRAAASLREAGDLAATHGLRLAVEFNSQAAQFNALEPMREAVTLAGHPSCGLLVDSYHLQRSGGHPRVLESLRGDEIAYVQFSDVPKTGLVPGAATDRLPPGQGAVPFAEFFAAVAAKGYAGYMSFEAPNPAAWSRPPQDVAREALEATRAVLPRR
jgi:2-keto-myo-inositol isomerase